jgi:hypothetical protein
LSRGEPQQYHVRLRGGLLRHGSRRKWLCVQHLCRGVQLLRGDLLLRGVDLSEWQLCRVHRWQHLLREWRTTRCGIRNPCAAGSGLLLGSREQSVYEWIGGTRAHVGNKFNARAFTALSPLAVPCTCVAGNFCPASSITCAACTAGRPALVARPLQVCVCVFWGALSHFYADLCVLVSFVCVEGNFRIASVLVFV